MTLTRMNGAAAAQLEFCHVVVSSIMFAGSCSSRVPGCFPRSSALGFLVSVVLGRLIGCWRCLRFLDLESMRSLGVVVCKGMLKNEEREVFASFSSTVTLVVQVTSYGTLAENFCSPCAAPSLDGETPVLHQLQRRQGCRR